MDIQLEPGSYVIAVSGGVDSVALLHLLHSKNLAAAASGKPVSKFIVAHYDHGIRPDSAEDRELVQIMAEAYGLQFVYDEGKLGADTSEADARLARYKFLNGVMKASKSQAIITAHHQDDLIETAILNILRGTGRKGLTSLSSRISLRRPALHIPKQALIDYANDQGLIWNEDSTNSDPKYLRNYVRNYILPKVDNESKQKLKDIIAKLQIQNVELDQALVNALHMQSESGKIDRAWFNQLPHNVAKEVMATWLRSHGWTKINRPGLEKLVVAAKVATSGKVFELSKDQTMQVGTKYLALVSNER